MALAKVVSTVLLILFFLQIKAAPADTLVVIFDKQNFVQGDSIEIEIYTEPYRSNPPAQTLHLWIDNIKTGQRWKYRYPFLKGRYKVGLKINGRIPNGVYAFNFLLQNQFLTIKGKLINATDKDTAVNFMATSKNKIPIIDGADLQPGAFFTINNLYFTDSVFFGFSPVQQKKENNLHIVIETPADSSFIPEAMLTEFIQVGSTDIAGTDSGNIKIDYSFGFKDNNDKKLLQEVVVKTKAKKAIDEYSEKYVGGLFANEDARVLNFLESDEAMSYPDLFTYLTTKFPNLTQKINAENGRPYLTYRNETVDIYVDEFLDTDFSLSSVSLQDVAMVKFFQQSFRLGGGLNDNGLGGSIAIYTKNPQDKKGNKLSNYSFYIKGYTQKNTEWK